ncbi:MAG: hypothetical protein CMH83_11130 [Nocardioides sp.]|nr:hypothetical protein [Nocardioides sp.]
MAARGDRVRVTGPDRRSRPVPRRRDLHAQTALGDLYLRSLLRAQLRLAAVVVGVLMLTVGALPVLFVVLPGLVDRTLLGVPVPWVVIGVVTYPWLVVLGWWFVRRAERNESRFAELVEELEA